MGHRPKMLIAGCGSIGRRHALGAARRCECAVFDLNEELARSVAGDTGATVFTTLGQALEWHPDGVVVATPNHTHVEVASQCIEAGAHVLVEKPISHSMQGLDAFLDRADELGKRVFTGCNMRFHPAIRAVRDNMHRIGTPRFAQAQFGNYLPDMRPDADYRTLYCANKSMGGGVILDSIHEIDYLSWLLGPVQGVFCEADTLSDLDVDVEDCASIILRHTSGARSEAHLDFIQRTKRRGLTVAGSEGTIVWMSLGKNPENCSVTIYTAESGEWEPLIADPALDGLVMYGAMLDEFVRVLANEPGAGAALLGGRDAARALEAALAAQASMASGKMEFLGKMEFPDNM